MGSPEARTSWCSIQMWLPNSRARKAVNALRAQLKNERVPLEMTADSDECDDGEGDKDDLHEGKGSSQ